MKERGQRCFPVGSTKLALEVEGGGQLRKAVPGMSRIQGCTRGQVLPQIASWSSSGPWLERHLVKISFLIRASFRVESECSFFGALFPKGTKASLGYQTLLKIEQDRKSSLFEV